MKKRYYWIGAAVLVAGGMVGAVAVRNGRDETPAVQTANVERKKIVEKVAANGKIQPKTQVKISADVNGKITQLPVEEGQWVEKGALLVELDRERYLAVVEQAEAAVRAAQASANLVRENLNQTEKELTRARELVARNLESQSVLDELQAAHQVEVARHASSLEQVAQADAALKQARDDLSKTTIYAPMSGTVSDLNKEQGEIALGSQFQEDVILVIADLSAMEARVDVDENDIVSVDIGQPAEIEVDALRDRKLAGTVTEIANSANLSAQGTAGQKTEFEVTLTITDPTEALRPGMTASARIVTKTNENAVSVPIQSVAVRTVDQLQAKGETREDAESRYPPDEDGFVEIVFAVEDGRAVARRVETGIQSDDLIEILDGLEEGEEIVTGSYRAISKDLENGASVIVDNESRGNALETADRRR